MAVFKIINDMGDMMKVTVNENKSPVKDREYPYLGISDSGQVVLFDEPGHGLQLRGSLDIGHQVNWSEERFTPFEGTITLENS